MAQSSSKVDLSRIEVLLEKHLKQANIKRHQIYGSIENLNETLAEILRVLEETAQAWESERTK